jgi:hypothetical protein
MGTETAPTKRNRQRVRLENAANTMTNRTSNLILMVSSEGTHTRIRMVMVMVMTAMTTAGG